MYIAISDIVIFFFKQKTAYELRISDWSSDVCSSDLRTGGHLPELWCGRRTYQPDRRRLLYDGMFRQRGTALHFALHIAQWAGLRSAGNHPGSPEQGHAFLRRKGRRQVDRKSVV